MKELERRARARASDITYVKVIGNRFHRGGRRVAVIAKTREIPSFSYFSHHEWTRSWSWWWLVTAPAAGVAALSSRLSHRFSSQQLQALMAAQQANVKPLVRAHLSGFLWFSNVVVVAGQLEFRAGILTQSGERDSTSPAPSRSLHVC